MDEKFRCNRPGCPRLLFIGYVYEGKIEVACSKCRSLNLLKFVKGRLVSQDINKNIRSIQINQNNI